MRDDDRVLVTGAASGLGLALVRQLVRRGCRVLATDVADSRAATLDDLPGVAYLRLDVTEDADWQAALAWVAEQWRGLDLLVNNAGIAAGGRIDLTTLDDWRRVLDINLLGVVRGCRAFKPMLTRQRRGHVVNIASAAGLVHPPGMAEYVSAKAGVVALSETLRFELEPYGVAVSAVCPTFFRSNLASSMHGHDLDARQAAAKLIEHSPLSAETIAARVVDGVDRGRQLILTDRNGRLAYYGKRFARPLYDRVMTWQARSVAAKQPAGR